MRLLLLGFFTACLFQVPSVGMAQTIRYPRVYGPTGRPYGPTQAHYQYLKQYGRPWHGYGGITANANTITGLNAVNGVPGGGFFFGSYNPALFGPYGIPQGYGVGVVSPYVNPFPSYTPPVPTLINGYPPVIPQGNPFNNSVIQGSLRENDARWNGPINLTPAPPQPGPALVSSPAAKLKSVRAQAQGDAWFQKQEYHTALKRYRSAVAEARERGPAHLRLAICYAALGHMDLAVGQLKTGLAADHNFVSNLEELNTIYGGNQIAESAMVHQATLWAKEDIRDPDRLFLLGVLLTLQGDERANVLLETGLRLAGRGDHFRDFLTASVDTSTQNLQRAPVEAAPAVVPQVIDRGRPEPQNPQGGDATPGETTNPVLPPLPTLPAPGDNRGETPSRLR